MQSIIVMKHKGSISQAYLERDRRIIPDLVRQAKRIAEYPTNLEKIFKIAATLPVKMYYIADDSAIDYVRRRQCGRHRHFNNPYKQQLYNALYEEVKTLLQHSKYQNLSLRDTVIIALSHPAPCIGLAPTGIRKIYRLRYKNQTPCTDSGLR